MRGSRWRFSYLFRWTSVFSTTAPSRTPTHSTCVWNIPLGSAVVTAAKFLPEASSSVTGWSSGEFVVWAMPPSSPCPASRAARGRPGSAGGDPRDGADVAGAGELVPGLADQRQADRLPAVAVPQLQRRLSLLGQVPVPPLH